ncbi:MAG TPA: N-acyl homoserine lactonase family protein [Acidimicrobiales bacterium]|nr:N-acyl homoserine lactonase family protein [Acidimicrobiales bacterium]
MSDDVQVHAVRFATNETTRSGNYLRYGVYGQPDATFNIDYFFWVIRGAHGVMVLDTGFDRPVAGRRGQQHLATMAEGLAAVGVTPADVRTVVLSHLHFDHVGNLELFGEAELVAQADELDFWSSAMASRAMYASVAEDSYLEAVRKADAEGRVRRISGDVDLADGVTAISLTGHTPGQQGLRIAGTHGVVLASDAVHFYDELRHDMPFVIVHDLADMYRTYDRLRAMEAAGDVVVPGHDAAVAERFPTTPFGDGGLVVDLTPH